MESEPIKLNLDVRRGNNWYKSVGISVGLGAVVSVVTYLATNLAFKDCFRQIEVTPRGPDVV
jgi:hypothetical protein